MKLSISSQKKARIPERMVGLFIEDINYGIDGGIYAEMIENRSFEFLNAYGGTNEDYYAVLDGLYGWEPYPDGQKVTLKNVIGSPVNENNPHYLRVSAKVEGTGFSNKAYDGIYMNPGEEYKVEFYARLVNYTGSFKIAIMNAGMELVSKTVETVVVNPSTGRKWEKYQIILQSNQKIEKADFVIQLMEAGTVEFDYISMVPQKAVRGLFRKDLVEALRALKPGFLRFPGGCVVEGMTLANRYTFKDSIGVVESRKHNWNRWAVHGNSEANKHHSEYSHYNQTMGIGYFEYFLLCEELGAKALPVVNVGMACQYQSHEKVEVTDRTFQEYIQEALDIIEFANGAKDTQWGALRSEMGHPAPFELDMLGIGNEQWETEYADYFKRYQLFEQAIHTVYPEIKLIGSAGPELESERFYKAWDFYRDSAKSKEKSIYAVDEHFYARPQWFLEHADFYDSYPREVKAFFGEYAAHPEGAVGMNRMDANTLEAALAEAAFLTGIERNSDVVVMASYAPLLARIGYAQWSPNLIWFNGEKVCATPSYYVQQLYGKNMGMVNLESHRSDQDLYSNVSYEEKSEEIIVKLVNIHDSPHIVQIETKGFDIDDRSSIVIHTEIVSGDNLYSYNTLEQEKVKISNREDTMDQGICQVPKYSCMVLRIPAKIK